ncbi:MAG: UDP-N-acetylglucosamine 4,6-dehydratase (inverting) [Gemmatimonadales bacterium]|nr:MAG: UDP-N-acetylglucosamine 4,6-dehydratase (inverting) [Gemmatimonadales bacterium]
MTDQSLTHSGLDLNDRSLLITGGTGSFGQAFVRTILDRWPRIRRLVILSRDELKQYEMQLALGKHPALRFFLGNVRDPLRLRRAFEGVEHVVHAAALKQVPAAEYNPFEFVQTNVLGAQNVIEACLDTEVRRVVALSTDKAAAPVNLYGATKLCSDRLFTAANNIRGPRDLRFSVVRYGNVLGSRGSVVPYFLKERAKGVLPITHPDMTRFNITLSEGVEMVLWALEAMEGGEVFVPKIPSYRITDLATAIAPKCEQKVVGIRPGEKVHEEMITASDSLNTVDLGPRFAILPHAADYSKGEYCRGTGSQPVPNGFAYNSGANDEFLSVGEIRSLLREHVDPNFEV